MAMRDYETEEVKVKCICGHKDVFTITKYKKPENRTRKIEELKERLCRACFFFDTKSGYDLVELRVPYTIYKTKYQRCLVDWNSYDAEAKMISVWVRKEHVSDEELLERIVTECGLTEQQARFLILCSLTEQRAISEWDTISKEDNVGLKLALDMIDKNNPSYKYAELHSYDQDENVDVEFDHLGVLDGIEFDEEMPF